MDRMHSRQRSERSYRLRTLVSLCVKKLATFLVLGSLILLLNLRTISSAFTISGSSSKFSVFGDVIYLRACWTAFVLNLLGRSIC